MKRTIVRYVYTIAIVASVYAIGVVTGLGLSWMTKTAQTETAQTKKISPMTLIEFYNQEPPRCGTVRTMIRLGMDGSNAFSADGNLMNVTVTASGVGGPIMFCGASFNIPRSHPDMSRLYELIKDGHYHWVTLQIFEDNEDGGPRLFLERVHWEATESPLNEET